MSECLFYFQTFTCRLKSPSPVIQNEVFFTQENYKKYSCLPSFVEFLEKHLSAAKDRDCQSHHGGMGIREVSLGTIESTGAKNTANSGFKRSGSNSGSACLGPEVEFPFVSKISIESQQMFLETFEKIKSGELAEVDLQKLKSVQVCNVPVNNITLIL